MPDRYKTFQLSVINRLWDCKLLNVAGEDPKASDDVPGSLRDTLRLLRSVQPLVEPWPHWPVNYNR